MKRNTTFWLALFAATLATAAIVMRLIRHGADDPFEIVGPAGSILLMIVILMRHRPGAPK